MENCGTRIVDDSSSSDGESFELISCNSKHSKELETSSSDGSWIHVNYGCRSNNDQVPSQVVMAGISSNDDDDKKKNAEYANSFNRNSVTTMTNNFKSMVNIEEQTVVETNKKRTNENNQNCNPTMYPLAHHHSLQVVDNFEDAIRLGTISNRLILVSVLSMPKNILNDSDERGCQWIKNELFGNDLVQDLIQQNFVFWQTTISTKEGKCYAKEFYIEKLPHMSVIHPNHRSIIWGIDGWTNENPWSVSTIVDTLTSICCDRYSQEQLAMTIDYDKELRENPKKKRRMK